MTQQPKQTSTTTKPKKKYYKLLPPFSFKESNGFHIHKPEAIQVRQIFRLAYNCLCTERGSLKKLIQILKNKGIKNRGKKWTTHSLYRLLTCSIYSGRLEFVGLRKPFYKRVPNIVSLEIYSSVVDRLTSPERTYFDFS